MSSQRIVELVNLWAKYEADNPDMDIRDFCVRYLSEQQEKTAPVERHVLHESLNGQLGKLIGKLHKYSGLYFKKAFTTLGLNNIEDVIYLIMIERMGNPKKSEVIYEMLSEFPSGIDVIKRLAGLGLVVESPDPNDRRSKRLLITEKGREVMYESFPVIEQVGEIAFDQLSASEKATIIHLLERLEHYHWDHYKAVRAADFPEIYTRLTGKKLDNTLKNNN